MPSVMQGQDPQDDAEYGDPTTIKQAKINQFAKHVEILDDIEIDVSVMLQRNFLAVLQPSENSGHASGAVCQTQSTTFP